MTNYVLGFLFSPDKKRVALIRKNKPDWQKGKLNGIGGKIEVSDDTPDLAMIREFEEETGLRTTGWQHYARLWNENASVDVFRLFATGLTLLSSPTDELVSWHPINKLEKLAVIPNLRWLIPLAFDDHTKLVEGQF